MFDEIKNSDIGKILENKSLKDYTTYKVGGSVKLIIYPKSIEKLILLMKLIKKNDIKHKILGNGSNVIFSDEVYDGIIIKLDELNELEIESNLITVGAGYNLVKLAMKLSRQGYTGLEFAAGIPGSVGGSVFMNAGAYKSDMSNVVKSVTVLNPNLEIEIISNSDMKFGYRDSFLKKNPDYICLSITMELGRGDSVEILDLIQDRKRRRLESQPLEYPSAGSVFRNPEGDYAGKLIEECGLKGKNIGGALISDKHSNFIVNTGTATGSNIRDLILLIKKEVKSKNNIDLKVEQELVNWE